MRTIHVNKGPLLGTLAFGVIDRGTNLLQVRPVTGCPLNCVFCSIDEGPYSKRHKARFVVDRSHLINTVKQVAEFKCPGLEAHLDCAGEVTTYPELVELVKDCKQLPEVSKITMQTHGTLLNPEKVKALAKAGIDRINLSIDSLDPELCKELSGTPSYKLKKVKQVAKSIIRNKIDLMITPLWLPGFNDGEMPKLIEWSKLLGASIGIQKYVKHKHGRKPKVKEMKWHEFNDQLRVWEKECKTKLLWSAIDFGIEKRKSLPRVFKVGERVKARVLYPGWTINTVVAEARGRLVTIVDCNENPGKQLNIKVIKVKHGIYLGKI